MKTSDRMALAGILVFAGVLAVGCGSSSDIVSSASGPSKYSGIFTGSGGVNGTIYVEIPPPGSTTVSVYGTIHITGGGNINVSGTIGPFRVSGGGYTLTGTRSNGVLSGTFTGPGGTSGTFAALAQKSVSDDVWTYCGTFSGSDSGAWDIAFSGTKAAGTYTGGQGSGVLTGTFSGGILSLTFANGSATGFLDVDGLTMSGTWMTNGGSESGTWTGSNVACD